MATCSWYVMGGGRRSLVPKPTSYQEGRWGGGEGERKEGGGREGGREGRGCGCVHAGMCGVSCVSECA